MERGSGFGSRGGRWMVRLIDGRSLHRPARGCSRGHAFGASQRARAIAAQVLQFGENQVKGRRARLAPGVPLARDVVHAAQGGLPHCHVVWKPRGEFEEPDEWGKEHAVVYWSSEGT